MYYSGENTLHSLSATIQNPPSATLRVIHRQESALRNFRPDSRRRQPAASDPPPALPGGFKVGEKVFYTAANQTLSNGDKLVHGQQGEVTGPATAESVKGKGVNVRFPGNTGNISCFLTEVRRFRTASAPTPPTPPTRDAAHAPCVPATASAAAPQPSLHEQPLAPRPTARVREGRWPRA